MESTYFLLLQNKIQFYKEIFLHLSFVLTNKKYTLTFPSKGVYNYSFKMVCEKIIN
uniref:Uncharacterized protein n=1 Tax=uncultured bacterium 52B7 TaxID=933047 RepID=E5KWR4_9BACT|nr:hypothetical protein [uncultured bacterium 52B7]